MIEAIAGALVASLMILVIRRSTSLHWMYSVVLIILPVIYMVFGIFSGETGVIIKELLYGLPFIFVGALCLLFGFKLSAYLLAAFWLLHGLYDVYHDVFLINSGVPFWYPVFCAAVDLVIGAYLLYASAKVTGFNIKRARADG